MAQTNLEVLLLRVAVACEALMAPTVTIAPGDIEIGAIEVKNGTDDTRAKVGAASGLAESDNALAVKDPSLGVTTGAAVITDAAGTVQQYLRGLVKLIAAKITVGVDQTTPGTTNAVAPIAGQNGVAGGAGAVAATVQRMTLASDDPAVATLGAVSGAAVTTDVNGTVQQYLRGLIKQWIAGTLVLGAGTNNIGGVRTRFFAALAAAMTRPANTTAYSANDAVSNNGTAASVTAITFTVSDTNDDTISLERLRLISTDTGLSGVSFRAYLFSSDPTASSGVGGGDNAAWSQKIAGFVGSMSGTFRQFSDGYAAVLTPDEGARIVTAPVSGAKTLFCLLQTLTAFTPSANSTTFTGTLEGFQGRA